MVRFVLVVGLSVCGYLGLTHGAIGPAYGSAETMAAAVRLAARPAVETASLVVRDGKVSIDGSVAGMFQSAGFIGPNETEKTNRARIGVDVLSLTKTFAEARQRLAALHSETEIALRDASKARPDAVVPQTPDHPARIAVASVSPAQAAPPIAAAPVDSEALDAIDKSVGQAPQPATVPSQLAYARANAPITTFDSKPKYDSRQLWCMAEAIYFEARGEPYRGQVAVAQVVMNRVHHRLYPNTICGVVFQDENMRNACQFSFACDGRPEIVTDKKAWAQAKEIADKVANDGLYLSEVGNATHYHAAYVYPDWAPRLKRVTRIGQHIFYRFKKSG